VVGEDDRFQPEFSTGERLASVEAAMKSVATKDELATLRSATEGHWDLDIERERRDAEAVLALRRELQASILAQDKAINKAEEAQLRQAELTREQADRREEIANQRLLALERDESAGRGEREGSRAVSSSIVAWASVGVLVLSVVVAVLVKFA
jgi:hypothetical protein